MLECPHLDFVFEMLKWISIVENNHTMPDNKHPVGIDDAYYYSICFKHILKYQNSQLATTN